VEEIKNVFLKRKTSFFFSFGFFQSMVCSECEKKQKKVITPDTWKAGARNTTESGGRIGGENRLLRRGKAQPYQKTCRICKKVLLQPGIYCQQCAYKRGVCSMCGKKILDTKEYRQSLV